MSGGFVTPVGGGPQDSQQVATPLTDPYADWDKLPDWEKTIYCSTNNFTGDARCNHIHNKKDNSTKPDSPPADWSAINYCKDAGKKLLLTDDGFGFSADFSAQNVVDGMKVLNNKIDSICNLQAIRDAKSADAVEALWSPLRRELPKWKGLAHNKQLCVLKEIEGTDPQQLISNMWWDDIIDKCDQCPQYNTEAGVTGCLHNLKKFGPIQPLMKPVYTGPADDVISIGFKHLLNPGELQDLHEPLRPIMNLQFKHDITNESLSLEAPKLSYSLQPPYVPDVTPTSSDVWNSVLQADLSILGLTVQDFEMILLGGIPIGYITYSTGKPSIILLYGVIALFGRYIRWRIKLFYNRVVNQLQQINPAIYVAGIGVGGLSLILTIGYVVGLPEFILREIAMWGFLAVGAATLITWVLNFLEKIPGEIAGKLGSFWNSMLGPSDLGSK